MFPNTSGRPMERDVFRRFCKLAYDHAGIRIKEGKEALVQARVGKRVQALGLSSAREYLACLEQDGSGAELVEFLDVISTNFTTFFREREHFEALDTAMKGWLAAGQRRFRLWSAACATGEEPYTMAMCLARAVEGLEGVDHRILATDISTRALRVARRGRYRARAMQHLARHERLKWFTAERQAPPAEGEGRSHEGPTWCVRPEIASHVAFARLNLAQPPFPMKGPFDVVFCRNVMIYLDAQVRVALVAAIEQLLRPGGLLMVGHAESLAGLTRRLTMVRPSVYRR